MVYDHIISFDQYETCQNTCADNAQKLSPVCSALEGVSELPTINCNINISQVNSQSASTTQVADSKIDAQMATDIQSKFESEIDKTINQTNKDLNFMQFNSSDERTSLSQSVRNEISNAISNSSKNISTTYENGVQTINFTNSGIINCSGCGSTGTSAKVKDPKTGQLVDPTKLISQTSWPTNTSSGSCAININQQNVQSAVTNQKASAALSSVFNSSVLNDLTSKYKLAVTQTNAGVNLLELLLPLIMICAVIIAIAIALAMTASSKSVMAAVIGVICLVAVFGAVFIALLFTCKIPTVADKIGFGCGTKAGPEVKAQTGSVTKLAIINAGSKFTTNTNYCAWDTVNHLKSGCQGTGSPTAAPTGSPTAAPTGSPTVAPIVPGKNLVISLNYVNGNGGIVLNKTDGTSAITIQDAGSGFAIGSLVNVGTGSGMATLKVVGVRPDDPTLCSNFRCLVDKCSNVGGVQDCSCTTTGGKRLCCETCPSA